MAKLERAEEREAEDQADDASPLQQGIAEAMVLGASGPDRSPEASAYLSAQTRLLTVQLEHMHEQRHLLLEHYRVRRWRERLQLSLQVLLWLVAIPILIGVSALVLWAMKDEALVIQPLKAPPALAAQGLDGTVLATKLLDGVRTLQSQAESARAPSTFKNMGEDEIKVEIPETGVSIGELSKALRTWLGHETQVTGAVYLDDPDLAITVRAGDAPGETFRGPRADLDHLLAQASEAVFAKTQPYLYAVYLSKHDRKADSLKVTRKLALSGPPKERGWAYAHWANLLLGQGDNYGAVLRAHQALARDPRLVAAENNLASAEWNLGHDEAALQARRRALALLQPGTPANVTAEAADQIRVRLREVNQVAAGDPLQAAISSRQQMELPDFNGDAVEASVFLADFLAEDHDVLGARAALARTHLGSDADVLKYLADFHARFLPYFELMSALEDWRGAVQDLQGADAWLAAQGDSTADYRVRVVRPNLAYALARGGAGAEAGRLAQQTPLDCVRCLRVRGDVAALQGRTAEAEGWYARTVTAAPSFPKPYLAWAQSRLRAGDAKGAAEKAQLATQRGPHFADAFELWAEALAALGKPRASIDRLRVADRYAPEWGRLHLIWGEELARLGNRAEAEAQFGRAAALPLSAADAARLAADRRGGH